MPAPRLRALPRAALLAALASIAALAPACGDTTSPGATAGAPSADADAKPSRMAFQVIVLDDKPDPFAALPASPPAGISQFQELIAFSPESIDTRTYVRLVVQPGETLAQARARAKPWFDAISLPAGDRFVFQQIKEENELTKKLEAVGVRTYIGTATVVLTRDDIADAGVGAIPDRESKPHPAVMIELTDRARESFAKFTRENVFRRLAVMIDDDVVMAPGIQEEISGGKISITVDPDLPAEARRAEIDRIAAGLRPGGAAAAPPPAGSK
ncbi:MAG: hypothetical protein R3B70_18965 [Polyangiaceae bacterium]